MRSVLGGELYAVSYPVDLTIILREELRAALQESVPVVVLTDSLSLFNVLIRASTITTEKRLMIYIVAVWKVYDWSGISKTRLFQVQC